MAATTTVRDDNAKFVWHPMDHPARAERDPPRVFVAAEGCEVTDIDGNTVLDAVGGLWNVNLGYSNQPVKDAITAQLATLPYCNTFRGTTSPGVIDLSRRLCELTATEGMVRAFFTSGGSDSVETALRLARQYWKLHGQGDRTKFLSFKRSYHGTHFGSASVNGNARFRRSYEPLLPGCFHLPFPWPYRNPFNIDDPDRLADLCLALIDDEITAQGPDTVAAFIAEPVLGAGGVYVPPAKLWPGLREICDRHGVLLISDEVITGLGRAGAWFGCRLWGVKPDIMCLAKALTSGYFPLGAVMLNGRIDAAFATNADDRGSIYHGYTYSGHPVGCAAALAALDETAALGDVPARCLELGGRLRDGLVDMMPAHPVLGEVRAQGLMLGLEIVADRATKAPAARETMAAIGAATYAAGVHVRVSGNNVILSPPLVLTDAGADRILAALDAGLAAA